MKRFRAFHPFLFTFSAALFLYEHTLVIASPDQIVRPLLLEWLVLALLILPAFWVLRDWDWTGILLTIIVFAFFASADYFIVAGAIPAALIFLWWLIAFLLKRKSGVQPVTWFLNISSMVVVLFFFARFVRNINQVPWETYRHSVRSVQENIPFTPKGIPGEAAPDIYYIVVDGYGRSDILKEMYGFDNSAFINYLDEKGFIIPNESRSNYPKTALSITSTLDMDYISHLESGIEDSAFWWLMSPLIDHSRTRSILEAAGYETVSIATDWGITDNQTTDQYFKPKPVNLNDFESYLLDVAPLKLFKPMLGKIALIPSFDEHGKLIKYNFTVLAEIPDNPNSTFTFAHIVAPHPPFVFDQNGNPLHPDYPFSFNDANDFPGTEEQYRQSYVNQVKFVNNQLVRTIDAILEKSEVPPIIILQADHGPGMFTDFSSAENTCLKERFSVFAAYYLPGADRNEIPNDLTAVNVFRLVFNKYFGAHFPLLENYYYYYKDTVYIYRAEDVTSSIDRDCNE